MKVQIQYVLKAEQSNDKDWLGRKAWVMRTDEGLAFGNIYTNESMASDLTVSELNYLQDNVSSGKYIITEISA